MRKRNWAFVAGVLATLLLTAARAISFSAERPQFFVDDAYIYLRYLNNTFHGCFLTFNCGTPPVEGFTSPAFLGALLVARWTTSNELVLLQVVTTGFLLLALSAALLLCLHPKLHQERFNLGLGAMAVVGLFLGADPYALVHGILGLETPFASLMPVLLFWGALAPTRPILHWLAVFSVLVRPEFGLFLPLLTLFPENRKLARWGAILGALVFMELIRLAIFGDFLPNTYWAKSGGSLMHLHAGLAYLKRGVTDYPIILLCPLVLLRRDLHREAQFILLGILGVAAFQLRSGGDFFKFSRLVFHFVPIATVFAVFGFVQLVELLLAASSRPISGATKSKLVYWLALPVFGAVAWFNGTRHFVEHSRLERMILWEQLGRYFATAPPNTKVAVTMIGAVGYFSKKPIIDLVGLVHPQIAKNDRDAPIASEKEIAHERRNTAFVLSQRPDFVVLMQHQNHPWSSRDQLVIANQAEREFVDAVNSGIAPYALRVPEIAPGVYWVMFQRMGD